MTEPVQRLLAALRQEGASQVSLIHGDLVLAEPAALAVAEALAARHGGRVEAHRRPPFLGPLLQDLRTFSMFGFIIGSLACSRSSAFCGAAIASLVPWLSAFTTPRTVSGFSSANFLVVTRARP